MATVRSHDLDRPRCGTWLVVVLAAWLALAVPAPVWSQDTPPGTEPPETKSTEAQTSETQTTEDEAPGAEKPAAATDEAAPLDADALQAKKKELEAREEQDEAAKQAIELYGQTLASLEQARQWLEEKVGHDRDRDAAPAALETAQKGLAESPVTTPEVPEGASLEQMKQLRDEADAALKAARDKVQELDAEQTQRANRRTEIPSLRQQTQSQLEELARQKSSLPRPDDLPDVAEVRSIALTAQQEALEAQLAAFDAELGEYDATRELLSVRRQRWGSEVDARDKLAKAWQALVSEREATAARQEADEARAAAEAAAEAHPVVAAIAEENLRLANLRTGPDGVVTRKTEARDELDQIRAELEPVETKYTLAQSWARLGALADVAARLRSDRSTLPDVRLHERGIDARRSALSSLQFELAEYRYELKHLPSPLVAKEQALAKLQGDVDPQMRETIGAELDAQLADGRSRYETLIADSEELLDLLLQSQRTEQRLVELTQDYREFIDQRIIWIRSAPPIDGGVLGDGLEQLSRLASPGEWLIVVGAVFADVVTHPAAYGIAALVFGGLLVTRRRVDAHVRRLAEYVTLGTDTLGQALQVLLITVVRAAWAPALVWFAGSRVGGLADDSEIARLTGGGLGRVAWVYFVIEIVRHLCRPGGFGAVYFDWSERTRACVLRNLRWFVPIALLLAFVTTARSWGTGDSGEDALGRLAFIVLMLVFAVFVARLLRPSDGILTELLARRRGGWVDHLRYWWYLGAVGVPLVFAAMTVSGYYYTALRLETLVVNTIIISIAAFLADGLITRSVERARRSLLLKQARRRDEANADGSAGTPAATEHRLDVVKLDAQARKMVRTLVVLAWAAATWLIWIDILPALGILDRVQLLPEMRLVSEEDLASPALDTASAPFPTHGSADSGDGTGTPRPAAEPESGAGGGAGARRAPPRRCRRGPGRAAPTLSVGW